MCLEVFPGQDLCRPLYSEIPLSFSNEVAECEVCGTCLGRLKQIRMEEDRIAAVIRSMDR